MNITIAGIILIPLGLILFFLKRTYSFYVYVFFIPLFIITIFKVELTGTNIKAYQYFGFIFVMRNYDLFLSSFRKNLSKRSKLFLLLFVFSILTSLVMPFIYKGEIYRVSMNTPYWEYTFELLEFTASNLTQLVYPILMISIFIISTKFLTNNIIFQNSIKIFAFNILLVFFSGLAYQILTYFNANSALEIYFNIVAGDSEYRTFRLMMGAIPRMYSLAGEPGYTAMFFLPVFAISSMSNIRYKIIFSIISLIGIIISGGTTGILGLFTFLIGLIIIYMLKVSYGFKVKFHSSIAYILIGLTLTSILFVVLSNISIFDLLFDYHISKIEGVEESGAIRLISLIEGIEIFLKSPLFGIGYGSHRSLQLIISLLTNIGLFGTLSFLLFVYSYILMSLFNKELNNKFTLMAIPFGLAIFCYIFTSLIAKSLIAIQFPWFWFLLASFQGLQNQFERNTKFLIYEKCRD